MVRSVVGGTVRTTAARSDHPRRSEAGARRFASLRLAFAIAALGGSIAAIACAPDQGSAPAIELRVLAGADGRPEAVEAIGFADDALRIARRAAPEAEPWGRLLVVRTLSAVGEVDLDLPAVAGDYAVTSEGLRFRPRFPFASGQRYRATWQAEDGGGLVSLDFPPPEVVADRRATTRAVAIYPSSDLLPANLLRLYVEFSAPMRRGEAAQHVRLLREPRGEAVEHAFVAPEDELWNEERTRLTLFFDPGRIKRGVAPHEEVGPPLEVGQRYRLLVDSDFHDAEDLPLAAGFEKRFAVSEPMRVASSPADWRVLPASGPREPLVVEFPRPFDSALLRHALEIHRRGGARVEGSVELEESETRWIFRPGVDWIAGSYELRVDPRLEDPCGNTVGRPFETSTGETPQTRGPTIVLPFEVELRVPAQTPGS